jgi:cellulose synthase/poly-beta-1,6-N-acetylglucosamine synthase-like glycosyltransferase
MAQVVPFRSQPSAGFPVPEPSRQPYLGDLLVRSGALAPAQLEDALVLQRDQDALLGRILLVGGHISREALTEALSEQSRLGRIDLETAQPDAELLSGADPRRCLELEAIPCRNRFGRRMIAISNPANGPEALRLFGVEGERIGLGIAHSDAIRQAIARHFGPRMAHEAEQTCPDVLSCRSLVSNGFGWRKRLTLAAVVAAIACAPALAFQIALGWVLLASMLTMGLRLVAIVAYFRAGGRPALPAVPRLVDSRRLPSVSIIVPLKDEVAVASQLLRALGRMEYPEPLLDIKLVLEAGDRATRAAIESAGLPPTVEVLTVPPATIRTKPRAMNYALAFCRGEIVGVYDAEDVPDPGQIRAIVQHLMDAPPEVACVQGHLDFYNAERNWLSRCFTIEYAVWFRVLLLGVQRLGIPIPLGGTTVFFRRRALEAVGAWDAHNVTEDADLGMRLARFGYRCEVIATTTAEEANSTSIAAWIRQRSRWLKGYAITWGTHMRDPRALLRDLGPRGFVGFQILFLGGMTSYLAVPIFWLLWTWSLGLDLPLWQQLAPGVAPGPFVLMFAAQGVMLLTAWIALAATGRRRMMAWIPTLPVYWMFGAIAAYRAIAEIFYAPFLWHKTRHGHHLAPPAQSPARSASSLSRVSNARLM